MPQLYHISRFYLEQSPRECSKCEYRSLCAYLMNCDAGFQWRPRNVLIYLVSKNETILIKKNWVSVRIVNGLDGEPDGQCHAMTKQWRHNGRDSVSNHQPHDCWLNRLFRRRSKTTSKLRVTGLCAGNSPWTGEFPAQMASYAENDSIWWRHHVRPAFKWEHKKGLSPWMSVTGLLDSNHIIFESHFNSHEDWMKFVS